MTLKIELDITLNAESSARRFATDPTTAEQVQIQEPQLNLTSARIDLPRNPIGYDWRLSIDIPQIKNAQGNLFFSQLTTEHDLLHSAIFVRWQRDADDWRASSWFISGVERTRQKITLSLQSSLARILDQPVIDLPTSLPHLNVIRNTSATGTVNIRNGFFYLADVQAGISEPTFNTDYFIESTGEIVRVGDNKPRYNVTDIARYRISTRAKFGTEQKAVAEGSDLTLTPIYDITPQHPIAALVALLTANGIDTDTANITDETELIGTSASIQGIITDTKYKIREVLTDICHASQVALLADPFGAGGTGNAKFIATSQWRSVSQMIDNNRIADKSDPTLSQKVETQYTRATAKVAWLNQTNNGTAQEVVVAVDTTQETAANTQKQIEISGRFLQGARAGARSQAQYITRSLVARFGKTPLTLSNIELLPDTAEQIGLGDVVDFCLPDLIQTAQGTQNFRAQIIRYDYSIQTQRAKITALAWLPESASATLTRTLANGARGVNMFDLLGRPPFPVQAIFNIPAGALIGAAHFGEPAIRTGQLHPASNITLNIAGTVLGAGAQIKDHNIITIASPALLIEQGTLTLNTEPAAVVLGGGGGIFAEVEYQRGGRSREQQLTCGGWGEPAEELIHITGSRVTPTASVIQGTIHDTTTERIIRSTNDNANFVEIRGGQAGTTPRQIISRADSGHFVQARSPHSPAIITNIGAQLIQP